PGTRRADREARSGGPGLGPPFDRPRARGGLDPDVRSGRAERPAPLRGGGVPRPPLGPRGGSPPDGRLPRLFRTRLPADARPPPRRAGPGRPRRGGLGRFLLRRPPTRGETRGRLPRPRGLGSRPRRARRLRPRDPVAPGPREAPGTARRPPPLAGRT